MTMSPLGNAPTDTSCFAAAFDRADEAVAVFVADEVPEAAEIVYVNESHVRLSGYAAEQLIGHSSMLLAGARPNLRHVREVARATRDAPFFTVTKKFRPDGSAYVVEMSLAPLRGEGGDVTHFVLTQRDIR
jgi:PAS domain S-box-containing protein